MKIESLQGVRGIAFLGIFLSHVGAPISWSVLSVAVFFEMSGFLLYYLYDKNKVILDASLKSNVKFALRKILKIYKLHLITMVCVALLYLFLDYYCCAGTDNYVLLLYEVLLNITLMQCWVPYSNINVSLNGVAWYLSTSMFLWFMFPFIRKFIINKGIKTLFCICIIWLLIEILCCLPFINSFGVKDETYIWFMYCFPLFRLLDLFVGCCIGKCYRICSKMSNISLFLGTVLEGGTLILTCVILACRKLEFSSVMMNAINNLSSLYVVLAAMWLWLFLMNWGILTKLLINRVTVFLGDVSAYLYLIHYVIVLYVINIANAYNIDRSSWWIILVEFCASLFFTIMYMKIANNMKLSKI